MMEFDYPPGATPLDPEESAGLRLSHITTRVELDRWEQDNIMKAATWAFRKKHLSAEEILCVDFLLKLHKQMLGDVWMWAGSFRSSEKNLGVSCWSIGPTLKNMLDDVKFWIEHKVYHPDEIATRFHHRLVSIHPFANGNGRHARLMADILLTHILKKPHFSWGSKSLVQAGDCRKRYILALQDADNRDYNSLLAFVRS